MLCIYIIKHAELISEMHNAFKENFFGPKFQCELLQLYIHNKYIFIIAFGTIW